MEAGSLGDRQFRVGLIACSPPFRAHGNARFGHRTTRIYHSWRRVGSPPMTPTFTDSDGTKIPITEPRLAKIMRALADEQSHVAAIPQGAIEIEFGREPSHAVQVGLTAKRTHR